MSQHGAKKQSLTSTEKVESWTVKTYNKDVVFQVIGKTVPFATPKSSMQLYYLTNGNKVFRLKIWKNYLEEIGDKLQINSVSSLSMKGYFSDFFITDVLF